MLAPQSVVCLLHTSDVELRNLSGWMLPCSDLLILFRVNPFNQEELILVKGLPSTSLILDDVHWQPSRLSLRLKFLFFLFTTWLVKQ